MNSNIIDVNRSNSPSSDGFRGWDTPLPARLIEHRPPVARENLLCSYIWCRVYHYRILEYIIEFYLAAPTHISRGALCVAPPARSALATAPTRQHQCTACRCAPCTLWCWFVSAAENAFSLSFAAASRLPNMDERTWQSSSKWPLIRREAFKPTRSGSHQGQVLRDILWQRQGNLVEDDTKEGSRGQKQWHGSSIGHLGGRAELVK